MKTSFSRGAAAYSPQSRSRMAGVGLVEVLIAVVVLAFGLLGIAAMQAASLRNSQSALERSTAAVQTYSILDRMRANRSAALIGAYDIARTCSVPDPGAELSANDLHNWITDLKDPQRGLGEQACATIVRPTGTLNEFLITIEWDDSRGGGNAAESLITSTRL